MKSFILTIGTLLISYPLVAQTNISGSGMNPGPASTTSPVTGAPVFDPGNTSPIPPSTTINNDSPVNNTGFEGTNSGTGTSFDLGGSTSPNPPSSTGDQNRGPAQNGWEGI